MALLSFPAWREYTAARIEANDAMMALLIASRIGEHSLGNSAAAPSARLSDVFGAISGIARLNVTVRRGGQMMGAAERHLAFMSIPFCLAVHDALTQGAVQMLRDGGVDFAATHWSHRYTKKPGSIGLANVHTYIAERAGVAFDQADLEVFRLVNRVRNRIIHHAGVANDALLDEYANGWAGARSDWEALTGRALVADQANMLQLGEPELVGALAVSKRLAERVNHALQPPVLDKGFWAGVVVEDYRLTNKQRFGQKGARGRPLRGHADHFYSPLALSGHDLVAVADQRYP